MRQTGAHLCLKFDSDFVLYFLTHAPHLHACSYGKTPLKVAIRSGYIINSNHNKHDVVALLRSVGAAE